MLDIVHAASWRGNEKNTLICAVRRPTGGALQSKSQSYYKDLLNVGSWVGEEVVEVGESPTVQNQLGLVVTPSHYVTYCPQCRRLGRERNSLSLNTNSTCKNTQNAYIYTMVNEDITQLAHVVEHTECLHTCKAKADSTTLFFKGKKELL